MGGTTIATGPSHGHPPRPKLAIAAGIIGHRPNRLPEAARAKIAADIDATLTVLTAEMSQALARHADVFAGGAVLSLVASLAEGADRIAARAATARMDGGEAGIAVVLDAVLPFASDDFVTDFASADSRAEFRDLLGKARAVMELPGARTAEAAAYEAAALTVLGQSDLVIAVWDGGPSGGRGGTTETLEAAARDGLPIVLVDAAGRAPPRLYWSGLDEETAPTGRLRDLPAEDIGQGLPRLVDALVRPPAGSAAGTGGRLHHQDEAEGLRRYLQEDAPATNPFVAFPLLMAACGVRGLSRADLRPARPGELAGELKSLAPPVTDDQPPSARPSVIAGAYGWADFVGALLAQIFRGAFILNFVFAALAVACAAVSIVQHDWKPWLVTVELALIVTVVANTMLGWRRQWHRRWFEGRELAERLRVAALLWTLGLRPDHARGVETTWTGWYARATVRAQGLRHVRLDAAGLAAAKAAAVGLLGGQCRYHALAAERMHKLEHRLEYAGLACLFLTIGVALGYLAVKLFGLGGGGDGHGEEWDIGLTVAALTAGLPALATATYGIRVIGDFAGISRRSERTRHGLAALAARLEAKPPDLHDMRAGVRAAAEVMLGDVAGWRLSAESRGLAIPG